MVGTYYVEAADWLREAGLTVVETDDWQTRARSSGGFAAPPLGVQWHHTAGNMNLQANLWWETEGSDVAPIGNMLLWPDGVVYMIAAGAANTAGKGGPLTMSRGVVGVDRGNSTTWAIEAGNNGTGQPWPQAQVISYFKASNCLNAHFGNQPTDLFTHALYAPSRKIDPARADAVLGGWQPRSTNGSGTWDCDDVRAEAQRRATPPPDDEFTEEQVDEILAAIAALQADVDALVANEANRYKDVVAKVERNNKNITALTTTEATRYKQYIAWHDETIAAIEAD